MKCQKHFAKVHRSMGEMELQTSGARRSESAAKAAGPERGRRLSAGMSVKRREEVGWLCGYEQETGRRQIAAALFLALPDFLCCAKPVAPLLGPAPRPPASTRAPSPHRQSSAGLVYGPGCHQYLPRALPKAVTKIPGVSPSKSVHRCFNCW